MRADSCAAAIHLSTIASASCVVICRRRMKGNQVLSMVADVNVDEAAASKKNVDAPKLSVMIKSASLSRVAAEQPALLHVEEAMPGSPSRRGPSGSPRNIAFEDRA